MAWAKYSVFEALIPVGMDSGGSPFLIVHVVVHAVGSPDAMIP